MSLSADEIRDLMAEAKTTSAVDDAVWRLVKKGEVPDFIAKDFWKWVVIEENGHKLEVLFAPTFFALGDDLDPWFVGRVSEALAQNVVDHFNAILPTWKLLRAAQKQGGLKIPYIDVKARGVALADIETPKACAVANEAIREAYVKRGEAYGDNLCLTWAKSYLVTAGQDGSHLCIGGGSWDATGVNFVQPPCSPHVASYADYSQRIAMVSRKAKLDGEDVDLRDDVALSSDPKIWALMNDTGKRFDPVFPNTEGSGASSGKTKDSYVIASDGSGKPLGGKGGIVSKDSGGGVAATWGRKLGVSVDTQRTALGAVLGAGTASVFLGLRVLPVAAGAVAGALAGRYLVDRAVALATRLRSSLSLA